MVHWIYLYVTGIKHRETFLILKRIVQLVIRRNVHTESSLCSSEILLIFCCKSCFRHTSSISELNREIVEGFLLLFWNAEIPITRDKETPIRPKIRRNVIRKRLNQ